MEEIALTRLPSVRAGNPRTREGTEGQVIAVEVVVVEKGITPTVPRKAGGSLCHHRARNPDCRDQKLPQSLTGPSSAVRTNRERGTTLGTGAPAPSFYPHLIVSRVFRRHDHRVTIGRDLDEDRLFRVDSEMVMACYWRGNRLLSFMVLSKGTYIKCTRRRSMWSLHPQFILSDQLQCGPLKGKRTWSLTEHDEFTYPVIAALSSEITDQGVDRKFWGNKKAISCLRSSCVSVGLACPNDRAGRPKIIDASW